jgi:hypothetical protein
MLKTAACLMVWFCLVVVPAAHSQFLTAVKPIPGYVCMRLNLPRDKIVSRDLDVPIFAEPSLRAPKIGQAAATLIVRSPMRVENGFAEILFLDGRVAWIQKDLLRPYATPEAPDAHCTPSIMSNGRPGFG